MTRESRPLRVKHYPVTYLLETRATYVSKGIDDLSSPIMMMTINDHLPFRMVEASAENPLKKSDRQKWYRLGMKEEQLGLAYLCHVGSSETIHLLAERAGRLSIWVNWSQEFTVVCCMGKNNHYKVAQIGG